MLRVSRLADYSVVVLVKLGHRPDVTNSTSLAVETGIPEPTVAKVLKALGAAGLVVSQRGARGGYRIARALGDIRLTQVIAAIDGPIALTACVDGETGGCQMDGRCSVRGRWTMVNDAVRSTLERITLADMDSVSTPSFGVPAAADAHLVTELPI
jgi:FeS assembly SUF system regulator